MKIGVWEIIYLQANVLFQLKLWAENQKINIKLYRKRMQKRMQIEKRKEKYE